MFICRLIQGLYHQSIRNTEAAVTLATLIAGMTTTSLLLTLVSSMVHGRMLARRRIDAR